MFESLMKRLASIAQTHPGLKGPILGLLMLAKCLDRAWLGARRLGKELRAVALETVEHLREIGLTPQGIHDHVERLLDAVILGAQKLPLLAAHVRQHGLPLAYAKGNRVLHTAGQWLAPRFQRMGAGAFALVVACKHWAFAAVVTCKAASVCLCSHAVSGLSRAGAALRADLPEYKRHAPRRAMAAALALVLCLGMLPASAFAVEKDAGIGLTTCTHAHDDACGFVAPVESQGCEHSHDDQCGQTDAVAEIPCDKVCTDGDGDNVVDHVAECSYASAIAGQDCGHTHNEICGFAEAVAGSPCRHIHDENCGGLPPKEPAEPEIPAEPTAPVCDCGAAPDAEGNTVHGEACPLYVAPPMTTCEACGGAHETADCPAAKLSTLLAEPVCTCVVSAPTIYEKYKSGVDLQIHYTASSAGFNLENLIETSATVTGGCTVSGHRGSVTTTYACTGDGASVGTGVTDSHWLTVTKPATVIVTVKATANGKESDPVTVTFTVTKGETPPEHADHAVSVDCGTANNAVTFTEKWHNNMSNKSQSPYQATNIVLMEDVTLSGFELDRSYPDTYFTVNLCLNGHTLTLNWGIDVGRNAQLCICDCSEGRTGKIVSGIDVATTENYDATLTIYGGTIARSVVVGREGYFSMSGGTLTGGISTHTVSSSSEPTIRISGKAVVEGGIFVKDGREVTVSDTAKVSSITTTLSTDGAGRTIASQIVVYETPTIGKITLDSVTGGEYIQASSGGYGNDVPYTGDPIPITCKTDWGSATKPIVKSVNDSNYMKFVPVPDSGMVLTRNVTAKALYAGVGCAVSYDSSGATGTALTGATYAQGQQITLPGVGDMAKADHVFKGWATADGAIIADEDSATEGVQWTVPAQATTALHAIWTKQVVPGGSVSTLDKTTLDTILGEYNYTLDATAPPAKITLQSDIQLSTTLVFAGVDCVFDLNGHAITQASSATSGGICLGDATGVAATKVTIIDTPGGGSVTGKSSNGYSVLYLAAKHAGDSFTISGGTFTGVGCAGIAAGAPDATVSLTITGGTFAGDTGNRGAEFPFGGVNLILSGGTFTTGIRSGDALSTILAPGYSFWQGGTTVSDLTGKELTGNLTVAPSPQAKYTKDGTTYVLGSFKDAVANAQDGSTITIIGDVELDAGVSTDKKLTLLAEGARTIRQTQDISVDLIKFINSGSLTLGKEGGMGEGNSLTIDGQNKEIGAYDALVEGKTIMYSGITIQNSGWYGLDTGFGSSIHGGTIKNSAKNGICLDQSMDIQGCVIEGNKVSGIKIDIYSGGVVNLESCDIRENGENGIDINSCDTVNMKAGTKLYGNGCGIAFTAFHRTSPGNTLNMTGGEIYGNADGGIAAGMYTAVNGKVNTLKLTGGKIYGNKSSSGAVKVNQYNLLTLGGAIEIYDNVTSSGTLNADTGLYEGATKSNVYLTAYDLGYAANAASSIILSSTLGETSKIGIGGDAKNIVIGAAVVKSDGAYVITAADLAKLTWDMKDPNARKLVLEGEGTATVIKLAAAVKIPVITAQPQSVSDLTYGAISGTLSVTVTQETGHTYTYQWQKKGEGDTWSNVETGITFTIPTTLAADTHTYRCVVTATYQGGSAATTSSTATVTVGQGEYPDKGTLTLPTAAGVTYGAMLSTSSLTGGDAGCTYEWKADTTIPVVGNSGYAVVCTPTNANYLPFEKTVSIAVTAKELTVTGTSAVGRVYNGTTSVALTGTAALSSGVVSGDTVTLGGTAVGSIDDGNVGDAKAVTVSGYTLGGADAGNYTLKQPTLTVNITAATPTVTLTEKTASFTGNAIVIDPATVTGVKEGDTSSGTVSYKYYTNQDCTAGESDTAPSAKGTYYVKATVAAAGNYTAATSEPVMLKIDYATLPDGKTNGDYFLTSPDNNGWHKSKVELLAQMEILIMLEGGDHFDVDVTITGDDTATGSKTVYIKDKDGNVYQTTVTYKLDNTAPVVSENLTPSVAAGTWTKENITVSFTATDATSGIDTVRVQKDGGTSTDCTKGEDGGYSFFAKENGTYTVTVTDNAGKTTVKTIEIANIDKTVPLITAVTPSAQPNASGWYTADVSLTASATDAGGSALPSEPYSFDGGTTWQTAAAKTYDTDGEHTVTVWVRDGAGNIAKQDAVTVKMDKTQPVVTLSAGDYTSGTATAKDVVITPANSATNVSGVTYHYRYTKDDVETTATGDSLIVDWNCNTSFTVWAVSGAGITSNVATLSVKRSALTAEELVSTTYTGDALKIGDAAIGTDWYTQLPTITLTPETTVGEDGLAATTYYELYKAPAESGTKSPLTDPWTIAPAEDGEWTLKIWTEDAAGNKTPAYTVALKVDATAPDAPTVTIPTAGGADSWHKGDVTVEVATKSDTSGVAKWEYSTDNGVTWTQGADGSFAINEDGEYQVLVKVTDNAGLVTTTEAVAVKLDATAPTASVSGVPEVGAWTNADVTVSVTASDATSKLAAAPYSFDNGTNWQAGNTKTYTDNAADIIIQIKDAAGNIQTMDTIAVTGIDKVAPAAPVVKIGGHVVTDSTDAGLGKTFDVTLTPTEGSPESYSYTLNSGTPVTADFTQATELALTAVSGENTLVITLTDGAGNETTKSYTVTITTETPAAPDVSVGEIPGLDGSWSKGDVTVTLPTEGGEDYVYRVSPDGEWKPITDGQLVFDQDADSGTYEIAEKVAVDGRDYYGDKTEITVKVDKTVPTINESGITATPALDAPTKDNVVIVIPVDDGDIGSGVKKVTVTPSATATVTGPVDGKYTVTVTENDSYKVTFVDNAGNSSSTTQAVSGIDRVKPTVTITPEIVDGKWYGETQITVTGLDTDGSGVDSTVITVDGEAANSPVTLSDKGNHTLVITVTDKAGNATTVTKTVNVDPAIDDFKDAVDALGQNPTTEDVLKVLDDYLNLTADEKEHIQDSGDGTAAWEDLQEKLEEGYETIKGDVVEIITKENPTIADIDKAEDLFNVLDKDTQDTIDKAKLDQLIADRDAAQTVVDQIKTANTYEEMKAAVGAYDRLTPDQKKLVDSALTPGTMADMKTDVAAVDNVITLIEKVKKPYTPATKDAIQAAKDAYDSLTQKDLLPTYEKGKLDGLTASLDKVKAVEDKMSALTSPYAPGGDDAIKDAQSAYHKLTADEKAMVDKELQTKLDTLYQAMLDAIAAAAAAGDKAVQDVIKDIITVANDPNRTVEDIQKVEDAYNKLPQDAKDKVDSTVVDAPKTAKEVLDKLIADKEAVKDLVDDIGKLDPDKLKPGNVTDITDAGTEYDNLTEDQKKLVDNSTGGKLEDLTQAVEDAKHAEEAIEKIPGHGTDSTNPDGTPDLGECTDPGNANGDNTNPAGGHPITVHKKAIEDAKYAYELLSDAGRKLIDPAVVTKLNNEYKALMSYLEYRNTAEMGSTTVEVVGLAEKVNAPVPPTDGKTVVAVELKVEEPAMAHKPTAPVGKAQALSVDVKLVANIYKSASDKTPDSTQNIQPAPGETILVKLLLPAGYELGTLEIVHVKDNGAQYPIRTFHLVTENGGTYAVFKVDSFSHFVFFAEKIAATSTTDTSEPSYRPSVPTTDHGSVTVKPQNPEKGDTVTISPKPDEGYVVDKVVVTDKNGGDVPVTQKPDGSFTFTQPAGRVTIDVTFKPGGEGAMSFTDVTEDDWFYDSVKYVCDRGLMDGTGGMAFSPYLDTSRAMIVTILHRLAGEPEAKNATAFTDVAAGAWYADGVAWAAENGIVEGDGKGHFLPSDPISREQLATILWRYAGSPDVLDSEGTDRFTDRSDISSWAAKAMTWAISKGVLTGQSGQRLAPRDKVTRAEAAAMLMQFLCGEQ